MRFGWLFVASVVFVSGCETVDGVVVSDLSAARGDTADTGLILDPQCAEPGFCGCDYAGLDLDEDGSDDTCIHDTAIVEGTVQIGARVHANAEVGLHATLGAGSELGVGSILAPRSTVGSDTILGDDVVVGRGATIGSDTLVGGLSTIGRAAVIGDRVDASVGGLTIGFGSGIGADTDVLGTNVTFGNFASIGSNGTVYADVVLARGATFGNNVVLGVGAVVGPQVQGQNGITVGAGSRIRKDAIMANNVVVGAGARIGRDTIMREGATVGDNARLGAYCDVGEFYDVEADARIPRRTTLRNQPGEPIGDPFGADEPPVVIITSPLDGADTASGSLTITGTVTDDHGILSVQVRVDDGPFVDVTLVNDEFTHTVTGIPDMSGTIEVRAIDTMEQRGYDMLYVSDSMPSYLFSHVWNGSVSTDWTNAANWDVGSVPVSNSRVYIPGTAPRQPILSGPVSIAQAGLDYDAVIDTGVHPLNISSRLFGGQVLGDGGVHMSGGRVRGRVENLQIEGVVYLLGYLHVYEDLTLPPGAGRLIVSTEVVRVSGNYSQTIDGASNGLDVSGSSALVHLDGNAYFGGDVQMSSNIMDGGRVTVGGDMLVDCDASFACFDISDTVFHFNGDAPQAVHFTLAGSTANQFADLLVTNTTGVTFTKDAGTLSAKGNLWLHNGGAMNTAGMEFESAAGTSQMDGNAVLNSTETVAFGSDVVVLDGSAINSESFVFSEHLTMSEGSRLSGALVEMQTELPVTSNFYTAANTILTGVANTSEDYNLKMPRLEIPEGDGRLIVGNDTVTLTGDFVQAIDAGSDGLFMNSLSSRVHIGGSATFGGSVRMAGTTMSQGVVTVAGDMQVACDPGVACFEASGTRFEFDGSQSQNVHVTDASEPNLHFADVVVRNPSGVSFTQGAGTLQSVGTLSIDGGAMVSEAFTFSALGGTSVFSNGGSLTSSGTVSIASDVQILDTFQVNSDVLVFGRELVMQPNAALFANRVDMESELPVTSDNYTATTTRLIGSATVSQDYDLKMPRLEIEGSGRIIVGGNTISLTGDYAQAIDTGSDGLVLNSNDSRVEIGGSATFEGSVRMTGTNMDHGVITVGGDMTVDCDPGDPGQPAVACFEVSGTVFEFDGVQPQSVNVVDASQINIHLADVVVRNPAGVSFTTGTGTLQSIGRLTIDGGAMISEAFTFAAASGESVLANGGSLTSTETVSIASDVQMLDTASIDGAILVFGKELNMSPDASLDADRVDFVSSLPVTSNQYTATTTRLVGSVTAGQDYDLKMPRLEIPQGLGRLIVNAYTVSLTGDFEQDIDTGSDGLVMNSVSGVMSIGGSATFRGQVNMTGTNFDRGEVTIAGDVSVICPPAVRCFDGNGTQFTLNGSALQTVDFNASSASASHFEDLRIESGANVRFDSDVYSTRDIIVAGTLTNPSGRTADANRDLIIDGGVLNNNGTFRYDDDLTVVNGGSSNGNTPVNY